MNIGFSLIIGASTPSAYYAFSVSDWLGRSVVVLLLIISIVAWTVMLSKGMELFRAKRLSERFLGRFNSRKKIVSVLRESQNDPSPVAQVYLIGMERLLKFYAETPEKATRILGSESALTEAMAKDRPLTGAQIEAIAATMEREISSQIMALEKSIPTLATVVSISPFLGLFGTVWGVMMAFCGVAIAGKPDFAALAPGVAGALLTTVCGLLVAIPSLIGYNFLTGVIRQITVYMDNFREEFMAKLKIEQLEADGELNRNPSNTERGAGEKLI